jgi:hypothetical protein
VRARWALAIAGCSGTLGLTGLVAACVKGGVLTVNVEPDASGSLDAREDVDVAEAESLADAGCGAPPWVTLSLFIDRFDLGSDGGTPLPGATLTPSLCPGLNATSDDAGLIVGRISEGVPFTASLTATNYIPELTPEEMLDADNTGPHLEMLPSLLQGLLPGFTAQSTAIVIEVDRPAAEADAGLCSQLDGVSFSVPGHPEAVVTYFAAGTLPQALADAGATTSSGLAAITGLATGLLVSPAGAKSGCTVSLEHGSLTGRVLVENGFASLATAVLSP